MPSSLTPEQAVQKLLKISRVNGWSVAGLAGFSTVITLLIGDITGIVVGSMAVACGLMELRGNRMLQKRNSSGVRWLIAAQMFLLGVILIYAGMRIWNFRADEVIQYASSDMRNTLKQLELSPEDLTPLVQKIVWAFYGAVILASCLYQGGLAFYYKRRQTLVEEAFAAPPVLPAAR
jgi:hypothetical protein